ncbi:Flp pilus assembly protein TadD, contains TPR repeats [Bryocella elongata]|uniref:Flp pilus assembly protein TadD, contains TPR repeats n=1 Tax=Bryocella elongata TaxID=863522 RepID=A0A1H5U7D6_9BACT|nr:tetratricopeptide repeat protein [Bryocella elongata]SEF70930.1 Flp pilus assembly protein TadD, contains TPR repeats [Bryocella elongata]
MIAAAALLLWAVATLHPGSVLVHAAEPAPVTWNRDIAPIVYGHCTQCHHVGGGAPFELLTYAEAKRWSRQMAIVTTSHYMPPWLPVAGHGDFEGDRHLAQSDIALIAAWVRQGAPEGDGPAPSPPSYSSEWSMGQPDLVLTMPQAVNVASSGQDIFINFVLPTGLKNTRWVRAMEIKPGPPALTHHANVIVDRTDSLRRQHPSTWEQGVPGMDLSIDAGDTFDPDSHFLFWKPDSTALVEPQGMPWRLDPGSDLVLNMHLKPTGKPEQVQARIGLYFTDRPATSLPMLLQLENDNALDIPAGASNFVVSDELRLPLSVDVLAIYPHAHYLGKRMEAWATLPNGTRRDLILIEDWDIDRQSVYRYARPVPIPRGSVLHMRYVYDNSAANIRNPNSPPVRVHAGNNAADEMAHLWLQVLPHPERDSLLEPHTPGDPRLVLEQAWMEQRLQKNPHDTIALYNVASAAMAGGNTAEAVRSFRTLVAMAPRDARAHTALGSALEVLGDTQGASAEFRTAIAIDPDTVDARYDLAIFELHQGDTASAIRDLRALLESHPNDSGALVSLGEAQLADGDAAGSQRSYKAAMDLAPENDEAVTGFAQASLSLNQSGVARAALTKALATRVTAPLHKSMAMTLVAEGDGMGALEQIRAWVKLAPSDAEPHRALAQVLGAMGDDQAALLEQRRVVELEPKNAADWNDLGVMEARSGLLEQARRDLEHALLLDPTSMQTKSNLSKLPAKQ